MIFDIWGIITIVVVIFLTWLLFFALVPQPWKPLVVFLSCAVVAAFGAQLLIFSHASWDRTIGLWMLVIFGLGAIALPRMLPPAQRKLDLTCSRCGYDLRGSRASSKCPECGEAIPVWMRDKTDAQSHGERSSR